MKAAIVMNRDDHAEEYGGSSFMAIPVTILFLTLDTPGEDSQGKCPLKDAEHLPPCE
jgi:hypothetical protein